jgi:tetratricopeptide (TPR) repeat protein
MVCGNNWGSYWSYYSRDCTLLFVRIQKGKTLKITRRTIITNADSLLEKSMIVDALKIYAEMSKIVSEGMDPEDYAHIKNNEGIGYFKLAEISNKEENLTKAIRAYEEALKIRTVEKYPVDYAMTRNNLGTAYSTLAEVRDKEENLTKAIRAYEEALKIYTVEKYPLYHQVVMSNIEKTKRKMKK